MDGNVVKQIDKYDVAISLSSAVLTASMDVLWIGDISLTDAHSWGSEKVDSFVLKIAKSKGYSGNEIHSAIEKLEKDFPMDGDLLTDKFGGGSQHHLRDFSHHPTPIGLIFSVLMQFTGKGYGTDTNGNFVTYDIQNWKPRRYEESVYLGTVAWLFHIVSDMAGSSSTRRMGKEGTGLPGPMLSLLKEISSIPAVKSIAGQSSAKTSPNKEQNNNFSVMCSKLFNGTLLGEHDENGHINPQGRLRFDLRTELGIVHESIKSKQYLPVALNDLIICSFYSVRRFINQIKEKNISSTSELSQIDIRLCLPWKNEALTHMRMIGTVTFSAIDISAAGIKAALRNKDNPSGFALDFLQGINYWGIGNLAIAGNSELALGVQKLYSCFDNIAEKQKSYIISKLPNGQDDWNLGRQGIETAMFVANIGTPIALLTGTVGVYEELKNSLADYKIATEERIRIEEECEARIEVIRSNRELMEMTISDYFESKMTVFTEAFGKMDRAITDKDIDSFIIGNSMIQTELTGKSIFSDMNEFDSLMLDEDPIKF